METRIQLKGSQVRCHKCGSPDIASVCHHCGRPMCSKHGPIKPTLRWFTENREFNKLSLGTWPLNHAMGAHCEYHVHSQLNYRRTMITPGVLIGMIGFVVFLMSTLRLGYCIFNRPEDITITFQGWAEVLRDPQVYDGVKEGVCYIPSVINRSLELLQALIVLGFGIAITVAGIRLNRENIDADVKEQGITLPVGPITNGIRIIERAHVEIQVDETGIATSKILGNLQGEIIPSFQFTSMDRKRVKEYKSKYHIVDDANLSFQGGYLLLKGSPFIRIISETGKPKIINSDFLSKPSSNNLLRLDGKISEHDFLLEKAGKSNATWQRTWTYKVEDRVLKKTGESISSQGSPVWVLPIMVERGKNKSLALVVQLNTDFFPFLNENLEKDDIRPEDKIWIERLRLHLSYQEFGYPKVDGAIVSESEDKNKDKNYDIEWHGAYFDKRNRSGKYLVFSGFNMMLERKISPDAHLRGSIILRVPSLISATRNVQYYSALGQHVNSRENARDEIQQVEFTYIHVDFDIALAKIALSKFVSVPCITIERPGAPTPRRLNHILNTFHSDKYSRERQIFITEVKESQPKLGDENSQTGRWHWQISGKQYHELMPIDFHLVMYGHGSQGKNGQTRIEASIVAIVDENTLELVNTTKENIDQILKNAMNTEPEY